MVRMYKEFTCFKMPKRSNKVLPVQSGEGVFTIDLANVDDFRVNKYLFFYTVSKALLITLSTNTTI